ncbi:MAG TPA: regulatory protein RecX [Candidatus Limnocylindrales bacterium]|jgi:regulatory protein
MPRPSRESLAERRARRAAVDDPDDVLAAGAHFLEARPRSTDEVRRRLRDAGYRANLVEAAIDRLAALGFLNDVAFARAWVESRDRTRPRGARALRAELRGMGIDAPDAEAALAAREALATGDDPDDPRRGPGAGERAASDASDEAAAARLLVRKGPGLLREPDLRKRRARAYALLARAGFDPGTAGRAASAWLATLGAPLPDDHAEPDSDP